jgi:peptidyl-prolyl cis-trans isomerase B (cyclophilin B)
MFISNRIKGMSSLLIFTLLMGGWSQVKAQFSPDPEELYATITTNRGTMVFLLYKNVAPVTVSNFVNLSTRGFYDGLTFHRVIENFMAQGGDPRGDGSGGPGYEFQDEIALRMNQEGILAMANSGPNTNGSQFFITHLATPHLNGGHTVFGLIQEGKAVIRQLREGDTIDSITITGRVVPFLEKRADLLYQWNTILDERIPNLNSALTD